ncbi:trypsin-like peptidase domain-containing protein [Burkholderia catarinensis]|uniref:trypsin-like peptidase domain-containing protein n=1 Tax=Burkholderia catarinensis TaxID=1108140 RepID=UPI000B0C3DC0|nr:trypsin-like peptidase domain-containing protein [Burkholderia catarinensis]
MPANNLTVRPLVGGIKIVTRSKIGTLGLVVKYDGDMCFATAGHVLGKGDENVGQPDDANQVGALFESFLEHNQDIAIVKVSPEVKATPNEIWTDSGNKQVGFGSNVRPVKHQRLWLQGALSGLVNCSVSEPEVDITVPDTPDKVNHVVLLNLDGDAQTQPGDSGAPVVGKINDKDVCYGVYGGKVVVNSKTYGWFTPFENLVWD